MNLYKDVLIIIREETKINYLLAFNALQQSDKVK